MSSFDPDILERVRIEAVERCPLCGSLERECFERHPQPPEGIQAMQCRECALVYMDGRVAAQDRARLYSGYNERGDREEEELARKRALMYELDYAYARRFIDTTGARVLDVGCGEGKFLAYCKDAQKYGVEIDEAAVRAGRGAHPDISFFASLERIPPDQQFDAIVFRGTLQYMPDLHALAAFCRERLRSGGYIVLLATPNLDSLLAQLQREHWVLFDRIEHFYCFGRGQVERLFGRAFQTVEYDLPYLGTPYEKYVEDYRNVLAMARGDESALKRPTPFFGSMLRMVLRKQ